ncbi:MAG: hypothetical protein QOJ68_3096 [Blastococcus sp.]|jgi:hypothetical protein|nr:hypothetical protein [Blastococcus sp.]
MPTTDTRTALDRFVRDPRSGRVVLVQWPNAPLIAWGVLTVGAALLSSHAQELRWAGTGALVAWAADELVRGASPARRVLGLVVLAAMVYRLVSG